VLILAGAPPSAQQLPTFRTGVRLVEANVLVHGRDGAPVSDLTAADFQIFEDGKEQKIEVFTVETRPASTPAPTGGTAPPAEPRVYSNRLPERTNGGVTVVLFDRLNSTQQDQKFARDQIIRFLATINPADRVALYVLESDVVSVLHDFTSDTSRLVRVLNKYLGTTSVELARSEETAPLFTPSGDAAEDADTAAWLAQTTLMVQEAFLRRRADLTTSALEGIANHLAGVPGRKNLVWVSGGFPVVIIGDHGNQHMSKQISRATRAINAADIAVYPVDIRGLIGPFGTNPSAATATIVKGVVPPPPVFATINSIRADQDSMEQIADATGGKAYMNTNAIGEAVRKAIDDSRVSYVLGYYSSRVENDDKFRSIAVKVKREGVNVRHRKGYVAFAPAPVRDAKTRLAALDRVMMSPLAASQVEVAAELERGAGNHAALTVRLDPSSIGWTMKNGVREGAIDVVIAQSEPDGRYFKIKETSVNLSADAERYQQMSEDGFTLSLNLVLRPTAYRLHVIVSDVASQAVGSLIIPLR
jgi:VWFA-related protein